MGLIPTMAVIAALFAFAAFCNYMARKPYEPGKLPLLPYMALQYLSIIVALVFTIHLVALLTGWDLTGGATRNRGLIKFN